MTMETHENEGGLNGSQVKGWGVDADPVNPMRIVSELSRRIPDNAIVTADSGSSTNWYAPSRGAGWWLRWSPRSFRSQRGRGRPSSSADARWRA